jgi:hypothetical protein
MPKLTASSGTNQYKEIGGGQGLKKTLGADYITSVTYNSIFEFAKAQNKYYADARSTQHNDKMLYQSYDGQYIPYKNVAKNNIDHATLEQVSKHTLALLVNTCKEEVNKNIFLSKENVILKNKLTVSLDKNVMLTLENKLLKQGSIVDGKDLNCYVEENIVQDKRIKRLDEVKKNRKDKNYQQETIKISLLVLGAICLYGIINYL